MNGKILVVDDDPAMVRTLCDILRMRGWESVGVFSGEAALAAQAENEFAFVLMDIMMPGIDGVNALKQMKARQPEAKVVLMTAHTAQERITEALREGALQVVTKPIDLASLIGLFGGTGDGLLFGNQVRNR